MRDWFRECDDVGHLSSDLRRLPDTCSSWPSISKTITLKVPGVGTPGKYLRKCEADAAGRITEADEHNNAKQVEFEEVRAREDDFRVELHDFQSLGPWNNTNACRGHHHRVAGDDRVLVAEGHLPDRLA